MPDVWWPWYDCSEGMPNLNKYGQQKSGSAHMDFLSNKCANKVPEGRDREWERERSHKLYNLT